MKMKARIISNETPANNCSTTRNISNHNHYYLNCQANPQYRHDWMYKEFLENKYGWCDEWYEENRYEDEEREFYCDTTNTLIDILESGIATRSNLEFFREWYADFVTGIQDRGIKILTAIEKSDIDTIKAIIAEDIENVRLKRERNAMRAARYAGEDEDFITYILQKVIDGTEISEDEFEELRHETFNPFSVEIFETEIEKAVKSRDVPESIRLQALRFEKNKKNREYLTSLPDHTVYEDINPFMNDSSDTEDDDTPF